MSFFITLGSELIFLKSTDWFWMGMPASAILAQAAAAAGVTS